jgi:hypothetical protein
MTVDLTLAQITNVVATVTARNDGELLKQALSILGITAFDLSQTFDESELPDEPDISPTAEVSELEWLLADIKLLVQAIVAKDSEEEARHANGLLGDCFRKLERRLETQAATVSVFP